MKYWYATLLLLAAPLLSAESIPGLNQPVKKFRLPTFNDQGYRTSLLVGDQAKMISATQIELTEMHYSVFAGDENSTLETTLLASVATVRVLDQNKVTVEGSGAVRFIRNDIDASGEQWIYYHAEQKHLVMKKNVHVVIRAELKNILK